MKLHRGNCKTPRPGKIALLSRHPVPWQSLWLRRRPATIHWMVAALPLRLLSRVCPQRQGTGRIRGPGKLAQNHRFFRGVEFCNCLRRKKRSLTLIEIMIVIVLIGLIGSVIGFNMKGSLDEGKAFKTRQAQEQIKDILMLEVARGVPIQVVVAEKEKFLENSGMVKNPRKFLYDGWNEPFEVKINGSTQSDIIVKSEKLKAYERKKREKLGASVVHVDEDDD